jgi:hypothetical protein
MDAPNLSLVCAQLFAGSQPDVIVASNVPRLMDLAVTIVKEAEQRCAPTTPPNPNPQPTTPAP